MNLWSDFDNHHQPARASSRARRLSEQAVLSTLRAWLLREYVAAYCRSLGAARIFRRCYWIDALGIEAKAAVAPIDEQASNVQVPAATRSGRGRKKEQVRQLPPALEPVVALARGLDEKAVSLYGLILSAGSSTRKDAKDSRKEPPSDRDPSDEQPRRAKTVLPPVSGFGEIVKEQHSVIRASWLEAGAGVLAAIEPSPAIFLLNPFGHTLFSYEDLAPLYQRTAPTELCLLISHKQVEMRLRAALRTPAQAVLLTALLRSDRWKMFSLGDEEASKPPAKNSALEEAIDGVIALFIASMQKHFHFPVQRISLPLVTRPAFVEAAPYTLLFATRRQDSLCNMNDAVCLYRREIEEQSPRGVLGEAWFATQLRERRQEEGRELCEQIMQQGRAQRIRRWPDLRHQVVLTNFGRYRVSEYDSCIQLMIRNKEVRCEWRRKPSNDEEMRTPGSEDTLLW